eukprot:TRINITY_DN41627_c0_g1_i1.p1 TRINITY_DN41627_c0_g1~~TRINITY_DN41627_c0_g1_i1.p1  ORF type:complete len:835 (+),score=123.40 TRINITY_DN41627_c0_g1_i1:86-2590(+)
MGESNDDSPPELAATDQDVKLEYDGPSDWLSEMSATSAAVEQKNGSKTSACRSDNLPANHIALSMRIPQTEEPTDKEGVSKGGDDSDCRSLGGASSLASLEICPISVTKSGGTASQPQSPTAPERQTSPHLSDAGRSCAGDDVAEVIRLQVDRLIVKMEEQHAKLLRKVEDTIERNAARTAHNIRDNKTTRASVSGTLQLPHEAVYDPEALTRTLHSHGHGHGGSHSSWASHSHSMGNTHSRREANVKGNRRPSLADIALDEGAVCVFNSEVDTYEDPDPNPCGGKRAPAGGARSPVRHSVRADSDASCVSLGILPVSPPGMRQQLPPRRMSKISGQSLPFSETMSMKSTRSAASFAQGGQRLDTYRMSHLCMNQVLNMSQRRPSMFSSAQESMMSKNFTDFSGGKSQFSIESPPDIPEEDQPELSWTAPQRHASTKSTRGSIISFVMGGDREVTVTDVRAMETCRTMQERRLTEKMEGIRFADDDEMSESVVFEKLPRYVLCATGMLPFCSSVPGFMYMFFLMVISLCCSLWSLRLVVLEPDASYVHLTTAFYLMGGFLLLVCFRANDLDTLLGPTSTLLVDYAAKYTFQGYWTRDSARHLLSSCILWLLLLTTRMVPPHLPGMQTCLEPSQVLSPFATLAFIFGSGVFAAAVYCQAHVCCCLEHVIDNFCLQFFQCAEPNYTRGVLEWNTLQALLRRAAMTIDNCFVIVQTATLLLTMLALARTVFGESESQLCGAFMGMSTIPPLLLSMYLFYRAAIVSDKCSRVPSLVNSITDENDPTDGDRQYMVQYIQQSQAGFYVKGIRLTLVLVVKLSYLIGVVFFTLITRAVSQN